LTEGKIFFEKKGREEAAAGKFKPEQKGKFICGCPESAFPFKKQERPLVPGTGKKAGCKKRTTKTVHGGFRKSG